MSEKVKSQLLNLSKDSNLHCSLTLLLDYGEDKDTHPIKSNISCFGGSRVYYSPDFLREPEHTKKLYDKSKISILS